MNWITNMLPDDDLLVLIRTEDTAYPIVFGHHSDGVWEDEEYDQMEEGVIGWMHIEDATSILDGDHAGEEHQTPAQMGWVGKDGQP